MRRRGQARLEALLSAIRPTESSTLSGKRDPLMPPNRTRPEGDNYTGDFDAAPPTPDPDNESGDFGAFEDGEGGPLLRPIYGDDPIPVDDPGRIGQDIMAYYKDDPVKQQKAMEEALYEIRERGA